MKVASMWQVLCILAVLNVPTIRAALAQVKPAALPASALQLKSKTETAIAARDGDALRALSDKPDSLGWLPAKGFGGQPRWKVAMMRLPSKKGNDDKSAEYLAIFHCYHTVQSIGDHFHRIVKKADGWRFGAEILESETLGYKAPDHKLSIQMDVNKASCQISDDVIVEKTPAATDNLCLLRLSSVLSVDSVSLRSVDGSPANGKPLYSSTAPGCIAVIAPGKSFTVAVKYHGAYTDPGTDTYINTREAVLTSYWWPHIARQPAKSSVTVTVPKGWTAIGQGEQRGVKSTNSSTTFSFRNEVPVCYFTLDAAPYDITSRQISGRKISVCLLKENPERAKRALDQFEKALPYFEKVFGPFPYTHYEMVETAGPFGGALEAYSFATYGVGSFGAVVHELAHTWWGGLLPNTYLKTLWNESFADYSDDLASRMIGKGQKGPALRGQHGSPEFGRRLPAVYAVPVMKAFDTSNGAHGAVGYGKGAQVLEMLEDLIGQDTMLRCIRRFRADHVSGSAPDWSDFIAAVRKETTVDYGWFFEQWLERGGVPIVGVENLSQEDGKVKFEIVQQKPAYRLKVPVVVELANGQTITSSVETTSERKTVEVSVPSSAKTVKVDPEGTLLMAGMKGSDAAADPFTLPISH